MSRQRLTFDGTAVALLVRGKLGPAHSPGLMDQHADVALPDGSPMGFFGEGSGEPSGSRGAASSDSSASSNSSGPAFSPFRSTGMGLDGQVYDYVELKARRKNYVDIQTAIESGTVTTVLLVTVNAAQAKKFRSYWLTMDKTPPTFNIVGGNCSTRASDSFIYSGILSGGIPGLDTPDNLYNQLVASSNTTTSHTGFVGFRKAPSGTGFILEYEPYTQTPNVNTPNRSSKSSSG
ncbi:hypothetical protein F1188_11735 [Roseospira marina]|uniref:Uncharacterized protein n=1 Tax=Roseospira marina TaxID=140057 RepID=A0A5M6IAD4_9PROT|nr:hypothetical protein [Roseospira marina]KAA5605236.1 hypothetical protein F1188_11735 [Roseospira marina]MBB4314693.1 hypothetical protein [Roseospira marina]MBB5087682.1 hypothetical protein [Roseospira marina]